MSRGAKLWLAILFGLAVMLVVFSSFEEDTQTSALDEVMVATGRRISDKARPNHRRSPSAAQESVGERILRMLHGTNGSRQLSDSEIASYLESNRTNALSLITAFEATQNREYLRMAVLAFPNDPMVQTKALFHDLFPEKRPETIAALKAGDPNNSLPHLLAAQDHLKEGNVAIALAEITAASAKQFNDYTRESMVGLEEAYLMNGRPVVDAKAMGSSGVSLPHIAPLKVMATQAAEMALAYRDAGDVESQRQLLTASWTIGTQLRDSGDDGIVLNSLVGLAIQNATLSRWLEGDQPDFLEGISVAEQLIANKTVRTDMINTAGMLESWLPAAPEHEIITYYDRVRSLGEWNARRWLRERYPDFVPVDTK